MNRFFYGEEFLLSFSLEAKSRGYGTLQEEALRIFNSLQDQESVGDPIPVIQVIIIGAIIVAK